MRGVSISLVLLLALAFFLPTVLCPAGEKEDVSGQLKGEEKISGGGLKGKTEAELKNIMKDLKKAVRELKESMKELPAKSGKEFQKTEKALKKSGRELKENTKQTYKSVEEKIKK